MRWRPGSRCRRSTRPRRTRRGCMTPCWAAATSPLPAVNPTTSPTALPAARLTGDSGTAAHLADQFVAGNLVLVGELSELLQRYRIGHPRSRFVGGMRVTQATQGVNYLLPVVC